MGDGGVAEGPTVLTRQRGDHLSKCRTERRGEVLRHGGREVVMVVIDHAPVNDRRALGARAECLGEIEHGEMSLFGQ